ncbi:unnamed protein product, partial [Pylaiella littoralis]
QKSVARAPPTAERKRSALPGFCSVLQRTRRETRLSYVLQGVRGIHVPGRATANNFSTITS